MFNFFLSFFVRVEVSNAYVNVLSIIVFFSINFNFLDMFLFLKKFCSIKYVLLGLIVMVRLILVKLLCNKFNECSINVFPVIACKRTEGLSDSHLLAFYMKRNFIFISK